MRFAGRKIVLLLLLALAVAPGRAAEDFNVERIGLRQGLNVEFVSAVLVDRQGFLWVGTKVGLFRFDGYSTVVFKHSLDDPTSISDDTVRALYEDRSGRLWVGTDLGGLNVLDPATGTFQHYRHDPADPATINHDSIFTILEDRQRALWVGTPSGLNRFDAASGTFERLTADPDDPSGLSTDSILTLFEDSEGALWIGTYGGGLNRRDPQTGRITVVRHDSDPPPRNSDNVYAIVEDETGALWVGTGAGVSRLDRKTGAVRRYDAELRDVLQDPYVTSLAIGPVGSIWIGAWGGGVIELDRRTGEVRTKIGRDAEDASTIERVLSLHATDDALWVATWGTGIGQVRFDAVPVRTTRQRGPNSVNDVRAVHEDRHGTLWLGTFAGLLRSRAPGESALREHAFSPATPVLTIGATESDDVLFGTIGGLGRVNRATGEAHLLFHDRVNPPDVRLGRVLAVLQDSKGQLWVGTRHFGLFRTRDDGRTFDRFEHSTDDASTLSGDNITALHEDDGGTLWVGTRTAGLNACDLGTVSCVRYLPNPTDSRALGHQHVTALLEDRAGRFWVGTLGGGLNLFDGDGFRRFTEVDGLPGNHVTGLAEDSDGSLWVASLTGLCRFDPDSGKTTMLGISDGLPAVEFNPNAAARGQGRLYFGTPEGLVELPTGTPFPEPLPSPTIFSSIRTPRGLVETDRPITEIERLELPHGEVVSFEFAVLDLDPENRHRYAYRMAGATDGWTDLESRREVTFTDLRPGEHTLEIKGRNARGIWSERAITLQVVPPFWMTGWFRSGLLALAVGAVVGAWRLRGATLERRHRELREWTRRLESARENERRLLARELHDEMGQVLSAAKINLQMLPTLPDDAARAAQVDDTVALVDQLLTHARALSLDLSPPFLDELGLGLALQGYLEKMGERSGLEVRVDAEPDLREVGPEVTIHAFRMVQEAMTNAIRHADASRVDVRVWREDGQLQSVIRDDGRGFDVEDALRRSHGGHHLGLLGMRERARSLGGQLAVDSRPGGGTEIRFRIPLH